MFKAFKHDFINNRQIITTILNTLKRKLQRQKNQEDVFKFVVA